MFKYALIFILLSGCGYRLGSPEKRIPGGYKYVAVPIFKNNTNEVGVEPYFTQAMVLEIERSGLANISSKAESQAFIVGEIKSLTYAAGTEVTQSNTGFEDLSKGVILAKEYTVGAEIEISVFRSSDRALLWSGRTTGSRRYPAPIITKDVINTANPIYNQSAKTQNVQILAKDMITEIFDRMTENF